MDVQSFTSNNRNFPPKKCGKSIVAIVVVATCQTGH